MQVVADNDFALFTGTGNSATRLLYQNNSAWPDQLTNLSSFTFNLKIGENTFYLLGLGGGGDENISGTVNGIDITTIPVQMSSDISGSLTDYAARVTDGTVANGLYDAALTDVQAGLATATWGPTTPTGTVAVDYVASQSPTGQGFHFDDGTAHLFRFSAADVNVTATPEPSSFLLLLCGGAVFAFGCYRRQA